jgi:hypothetical protein
MLRAELTKSDLRRQGTNIGETEITISFGDRNIKWQTGKMISAKSTDVNIIGTQGDRSFLFTHLNAYWATLPRENQAAIFEAYHLIYNTLQDSNNVRELIVNLTPLCGALVSLHHYDDVHHWVCNYSNIHVPSQLNTTYDPINIKEKGSRDQTYLRTDYEELISLCLIFRAMLPVWAEVIYRTSGGTKSPTKVDNVWKEYHAFNLLTQSKLHQTPAMLKLVAYINETVTKMSDDTSGEIDLAIFGAVSKEEFPEWLLAILVVQKLTLIDFSGHDDEMTLAKVVFSKLSEKLKHLTNTFGGGINVFLPKDMLGNDENNRSIFENRGPNESMMTGDVKYLQICAEDLESICIRNHVHYDATELQLLISAMEATKPEDLTNHHYILAQWVMYRAGFPAMGVYELECPQFVQVLAVTVYVLWKLNFTVIAAIASGKSAKIIPMDTVAPLPTELFDRLMVIFPYQLNRAKSKTKAQSRNSNPGFDAIHYLYREMNKTVWYHRLPAVMTTGSIFSQRREIEVPKDFMSTLALAAIHFAEQ